MQPNPKLIAAGIIYPTGLTLAQAVVPNPHGYKVRLATEPTAEEAFAYLRGRCAE